MNPLQLIDKYYSKGSQARYLLIEHSKMVTQKALEIAGRVAHLRLDTDFIKKAAMLHDIGILFTSAPEIGCDGEKPYICHGYLGRALLEKEGLPAYALVCERHVGVGITMDDIVGQQLPVPKRDMVPISLEEQIICFADKFFSKEPHCLYDERPFENIKTVISGYGKDKVMKLEQWREMFGN
jgi:uncharacterized protein